MRDSSSSTAASIGIAGASESPGRGLARVQKKVSEVIVTRLLMAADSAVVLFTGLASVCWGARAGDADWRVTGLVMALGAILGVNILNLVGAYKFGRLGRAGASAGAVVAGWLLSLGILVAVATLAGSPPTAAEAWLAIWGASALSLLLASRLALALQIARWRRDGRLDELVAVLGAGPIARRLLMRLKERPDSNIRVAGVYDDQLDGVAPGTSCLGHRIAGNLDDLIADVRRLGITTVMVALPLSADLRVAAALNKLCLVPVDVRLCPDEFGLQLGTCQVSHIAGLTFFNVLDRPLRDWRRVGKEIEDRVLAAAILLLIAPLMLGIALLIKLDSPGPVLFRQRRYGFNNGLIEVLKFRTMYHESQDADAEQLTRRNDPRVTRVGAFLRRTSLDELPQFINVLCGEMSIVGPRPHALAAKAGRLLYQDAVRYYDARHRMKPGITGWAQVNGWRGETNTVEQIRKRVEHDLYYIENWSIGLDLKIIVRTVFGGFTGRYAY
jgi:Undecaprenyl-phosphate glucose phosphotransferase